MTLEWNPRLETCDVQINQQHKRLFALVNQLIHATDSTQARDSTRRLLDYLDAHFAYEEATMEHGNYPDALEHRRDHIQLGSKLRFLQKKQPDMPPALYKFQLVAVFKEWMNHHIPEHDVRLAEFLSYGDTCHAEL